MSKAEKTRAFIIERSAPVFNVKGYAGTSLSDIMEATGLTKGAIYGNFENKDEVAVCAYQYQIQALEKRIAELMNEQESASGKLNAFTGYYRNNWQRLFEKGGCPIQNASVEADDHVPFLKEHVQKSVKNWVKSIHDVIEAGRISGEFKEETNSLESAYSMVILLEGGIMLSKIMNRQHLLFQALDRMDMLVEQELKK